MAYKTDFSKSDLLYRKQWVFPKQPGWASTENLKCTMFSSACLVLFG